MKTLRWIGTMLVAMLMCLNFSACSDDDDKLLSGHSLENAKMYVYARENYLNGELVAGYKFTPRVWIFYADGSFASNPTGTWQMKNNTIIITTTDYGCLENIEYKILESKVDDQGNWELILRKEYDDNEFDYQLYYMRFMEYINE